jgi:drug/metabolite transporter (DMT)-like permease
MKRQPPAIDNPTLNPIHNLREMSAAPLLSEDKPLTYRHSGWNGWGYAMAALGAIMFSMKAILVKLAYLPMDGLPENAVGASTLLALRMALSVPVYMVIGAWVIRKRKQEGKVLPNPHMFIKAGLIGMVGYYICSYLDFEGLKLITAQLERLLLFTYPAFVLILGALFYGKPLSLRAMICVAIAYSGIIVIFLRGNIATGLNVPLGTAMLLVCAVLFAFFQIWAKGQIDKMGSSLFTCAAMIAAGAAIFTHFFAVNLYEGALSRAFDLPPRIYLIGGAIALLSTLIPSFLINIALSRIGAQAVATLGMLSPIATIVLAVFWLNEPFGWVDALGTGLTILGIGLFTYFDRREKTRRAY